MLGGVFGLRGVFTILLFWVSGLGGVLQYKEFSDSSGFSVCRDGAPGGGVVGFSGRWISIF